MKHILMSYFACLLPPSGHHPDNVRARCANTDERATIGKPVPMWWRARAALKVGDRGGDWRCPFGGRWPFRRELIPLRGIG